MRRRRPAPPGPSQLPLVLIVIGALLLGATFILVARNRPAVTDAGVVPLAGSPATGASSAAAADPAGTGATAGDAGVPSVVGPGPASTSTATPTPVGAGPAAATGAAVAPPAAGSTATGAAHRSTAVPTTGARGTTPAAPAVPSGPPATLQLPRLGVTADVAPIVSKDGVLQIPENVGTVGWWLYSAVPGAARGSTVLAGHIDSAVQGPGALYRLGELGPGDRITVTTANGAEVAYVVQARHVYVKSQGLPADLWDQQGRPRLVLISCGGPFDAAQRSYQDNIVVYATPA
ncbi:class F sortase [Nakamurella endophytica]|uniref:class F sortase n=1 Tax=Nakamurella endophytica TaxID=1748367 RepID=UPI001667EC16|nr:class F sortase [Nakamurella endophytica]